MTKSPITHLCMTHSPLTSMVFEAAMKSLNIPSAQTALLCRRAVPAGDRGRDVETLAVKLQDAYKSYSAKQCADLVRRLYQHIDELTGGGAFHAYVPHTRQILLQEIIGHPRCEKYFFIEEGFTSMAWDSDWNPPPRGWKRLQNRLRDWRAGGAYRSDRPMFDIRSAKFAGAFAISKHAFAGMPNVSNITELLPPLPPAEGPGHLYAILDTCYLHRGVPWQAYEDALVKSAAAKVGNHSSVRIKFHFADQQAEAHFKAVQSRLGKAGLTAERLPSEFCVERALVRGDLVLFGVSSLGYYAAIAGARVECFANDIDGISVQEWISNHRLPPNFPQVVGLAG